MDTVSEIEGIEYEHPSKDNNFIKESESDKNIEGLDFFELEDGSIAIGSEADDYKPPKVGKILQIPSVSLVNGEVLLPLLRC